MSAYKQLLSTDVIITPFEVNKEFTFLGVAQLTGSSVSIDRFLGRNVTGSFNPISDPTTGTISTEYQRLIYKSVEELYYSNYISSSYGDNINRATLIPGRDKEGDRLVGTPSNQSGYNYNQSTLTYSRYFPTGSNSTVGVISIPSRLFGDYIKPRSFKLTTDSGSLTDDGEGNIILNSVIVGNIFYPHGLVIITGNTNAYITASVYGAAVYGASLYGQYNAFADDVINFITSSNVTCSFSSSYTIQETQYKCTIRENEYNLTLNPSLITGSISSGRSNGTMYGFATASYFSPYITTIGLYDDDQNLLAVAKLSQPIQAPPTTDLSILINIDK